MSDIICSFCTAYTPNKEILDSRSVVTGCQVQFFFLSNGVWQQWACLACQWQHSQHLCSSLYEKSEETIPTQSTQHFHLFYIMFKEKYLLKLVQSTQETLHGKFFHTKLGVLRMLSEGFISNHSMFLFFRLPPSCNALNSMSHLVICAP